MSYVKDWWIQIEQEKAENPNLAATSKSWDDYIDASIRVFYGTEPKCADKLAEERDVDKYLKEQRDANLRDMFA